MNNKSYNNLNITSSNESTTIEELANLFSKFDISDQKPNCNSNLGQNSTPNLRDNLNQLAPKENAPNITNEFDECLFIGSLDGKETRNNLYKSIYNYFNKEYQVDHLIIHKNKYNNSVAYVYFSHPGTVASLINRGNSLIIDGKEVKIDIAFKLSFLFISNIEPETTFQQFSHKIFITSEVRRYHLLNTTNNSCKLGYVNYSTLNDAVIALNKLRRSTNWTFKIKSDKVNSFVDHSIICVDNIDLQTVTRSILNSKFKKYGYIKEIMFKPNNKELIASANIKYSHPEGSYLAVEDLNNTFWLGYRIKVYIEYP